MMESLEQHSRETGDETVIELTADSQRACAIAVKEMGHALHFLAEQAVAGKLTAGTRTSTLGIAESQFSRLCKLLDFGSVLAREYEARHVEIRTLNGRVRELESQIGKAALSDTLPHTLKALHEKMRRWWNSQGFSLVREAGFGEYRYTAEFSLMVNDLMSDMFEDEAVSAEKRFAARIARMRETFDLDKGDGRGSFDVLDTQRNRDALHTIFVDTFPSAMISAIESSGRGRHGARRMILWTLKAVIDAGDIVRLAEPSKDD